MSFWLDDDDDGPSLGNLMGSQSQSQSQQLSQEQSQSQSQRRLSQATAAVWHCEECGGLESYNDVASGHTICSDCFTASQKKNDDQHEMDYDDVMALAAKARGGVLVQQRRSRKSVYNGMSGLSGDGKSRKLPLEDNSVVLPDLEQCMAGFMTVCRALIRILVQDLHALGSHDGDTNEQTTTMLQLEKTVETLFQTYLRAWADGAEHYGELAPDTRFSLRDSFLNSEQREMIYRHVSDRVDREEKKKNSNKNDADDGSDSDNSNDSNTSRNLLESDNEHDDEGDEDDDGENGGSGRVSAKRQSQCGIIRNVLNTHAIYRRKGRKEAALSLIPSMTSAAALVWLAVHRMCCTRTDSSSLSTAAASPPTIITSRQFVTWMNNGSLPLQSTFSLLTPEQQKVLYPVRLFFTCASLPTTTSLEVAARLWTLACGLKSVAQWNGTHAYVGVAAAEAARVEAIMENIAPAKSQSYFLRRALFRRKTPKKGQDDLAAEKLRFVTPQSVPVVAAQLIADTGLSQEVLNWTLAIMGCSKPTPYQFAVMAALTEAAYQFGDVSTAPPLPASFSSVTGRMEIPEPRPDHERAPRRVGAPSTADFRRDAANLVVTLPWPGADPIHLTTCAHTVAVILYASQLCPNWRTAWTYRYQDLQRDLHADGRTNKSDKRNRAVPWNAQQFPRLVGNGSTVAGYLNFYEESLRDADHTLAPDFVNRLDTTATFLTMTATKTAPATRSDRGRRRRISSDDDNDDDARVDEQEHDHCRVVRPCTQLAGVRRPPPQEQQKKQGFQKKDRSAAEIAIIKKKQQEPKRKPGRPRKEKSAEAPKPKRGRPRKEEPKATAAVDAFAAAFATTAIPQVQHTVDVAANVAVGRLVFDPSNLDVDQRLLLEFLAYTSRLDASWIMDAYVNVFSRRKKYKVY